VMPRRQELPAEALYEPHEAEALFMRGDRSVLVLSHGILSLTTPTKGYPPLTSLHPLPPAPHT
jgi:hypothetical protein